MKGESERARERESDLLRDLYEALRSNAPCMLAVRFVQTLHTESEV